MPSFDEALRRLVPVDQRAGREAEARHDTLTKPAGSLGRLERAGVQLAAVARRCPPSVPAPAAVAVFAGDHGVLAEGVSPWPVEVTAQMVANFCAGGAAVNVLAAHVGARVIVVDVGVAGDLAGLEGLRSCNVRRGTGNIAVEPAMTPDEVASALSVGASIADELVGEGARCLLTGDMGIGNTTPSAASIAAFASRPAGEVTGRGTGIDDERLNRKVAVVDRALDRIGLVDRALDRIGVVDRALDRIGVVDRALDRFGVVDRVGAPPPGEASLDPAVLLAELGGLEIAVLTGYIVAGASAGVPVVLDGVIACAAALAATALAPACRDYLFAGHRSSEPGAAVALAHLGLEPLLDLELRLGEGTGACLALPILQAAAKVLRDMATFDSAGVTDRTD